MRRFLTGLIALGILLAVLLAPTAVGAVDCCEQYEPGSCCWAQCCAEQTFEYKVSYLKKVPTGIFYQGVEMVAGVWTTEFVEAHDEWEAAEMLGLRYGYDCFVTKA